MFSLAIRRHAILRSSTKPLVTPLSGSISDPACRAGARSLVGIVEPKVIYVSRGRTKKFPRKKPGGKEKAENKYTATRLSFVRGNRTLLRRIKSNLRSRIGNNCVTLTTEVKYRCLYSESYINAIKTDFSCTNGRNKTECTYILTAFVQ